MRCDGFMKYPRTRHLEGSRLQDGDTDDVVRCQDVAGAHAVIEEKMDGANSGISFSAGGDLQLQSRGHYLTGGGREKHFEQLKLWANAHQDWLWDKCGDQLIVFGEWMSAKHSVYYDALPHLFLEFDIYDKASETFWSTPRRHAHWAGTPMAMVPVLHEGPAPSTVDAWESWIRPSVGKTPAWREHLQATARQRGLDPVLTLAQTDQDDLAEGLYIKLEDAQCVQARMKFIRGSFTQTLIEQDEHWLRRPIVPNGLRADADLFVRQAPPAWPQPAPARMSRGRRR